MLATLFSISITPTGQTTKAKAVKNFPHNILLLKVDSFEGFSNWSKTDGMVNNHLSSCNSHQFSFELQQYVASHYEKNSIKLTTFGILCTQ